MNYLWITVMILIAGCGNGGPKTTKAVENIRPFEWTVVNSGFVRAETHEIILTDTSIQVIKGERPGSVAFRSTLTPSDTLKRIASWKTGDFKERYSNDLIADGLQLSLQLRSGDSTRRIFISNFYEPRIGMLMHFINARVPETFRIWYDEQELSGR